MLWRGHRSHTWSVGAPVPWMMWEMIPPGQQAGLSTERPLRPSTSLWSPRGLAGFRAALFSSAPALPSLPGSHRRLALCTHRPPALPTPSATFTQDSSSVHRVVSHGPPWGTPRVWGKVRGPPTLSWWRQRPGYGVGCKVFPKPLLFGERDSIPPSPCWGREEEWGGGAGGLRRTREPTDAFPTPASASAVGGLLLLNTDSARANSLQGHCVHSKGRASSGPDSV